MTQYCIERFENSEGVVIYPLNSSQIAEALHEQMSWLSKQFVNAVHSLFPDGNVLFSPGVVFL